MKILTKENFWDEIQTKFPVSFRSFAQWIDEYKIRVGWDAIFNGLGDRRTGAVSPKYHDLPVAMQIGIFLQYVSEVRSKNGLEIPLLASPEDFKLLPVIIYEFFRFENMEC